MHMHLSCGKRLLVLCALFLIPVPVLCQTGSNPSGDYEVGRLIRPLPIFGFLGIDHHDVLVRHRPDERRRGFFPNSGMAAVGGYWEWATYTNDPANRRFIGWVSGYVDDLDPRGAESMTTVDQARYNTVRTRISNCTSNRYHLNYFHCQDWATLHLGP
jgi:hypothetical protein